MEDSLRSIVMKIEVYGTERVPAELYQFLVKNNMKLLMRDTCLRHGLILTRIYSKADHAEFTLTAVTDRAFENFRTYCEQDRLEKFVKCLLPNLASLEGILEVCVRVDMQRGQEQRLGKLLQRNFIFLEEEIDLYFLKDRLVKSEVFSPAEVAEVLALGSRRQKSHQLLLKLSKKDEDTLKAFLHVLLDAEEKYVFQHLLDESKKTEHIATVRTGLVTNYAYIVDQLHLDVANFTGPAIYGNYGSFERTAESMQSLLKKNDSTIMRVLKQMEERGYTELVKVLETPSTQGDLFESVEKEPEAYDLDCSFVCKISAKAIT